MVSVAPVDYDVDEKIHYEQSPKFKPHLLLILIFFRYTCSKLNLDTNSASSAEQKQE